MGYACSYEPELPGTAGAGERFVMHWTLLPATEDRNAEVSVCLEKSPAVGWVSLGVQKTVGQMVPGEAVVGMLDGGAEGAGVRAVDLPSYSSSAYSPGVWGEDPRQALFEEQLERVGDVLRVRFSRELENGGDFPYLESGKTPFMFAYSPLPWPAPHFVFASFELSLESGAAEEVEAVTTAQKALYSVHAVLGALAWCVCVPFSVASARKTWESPASGETNLKARWFKLHRALNTATAVLTLGGAAIGYSLLAARPGKKLSLHGVLGTLTTCLMVLQIALAVSRPPGDSARRVLWYWAHRIIGYLTLAAGVLACALGALRVRDIGMWAAREAVPVMLALLCVAFFSSAGLGLGWSALLVGRLRGHRARRAAAAAPSGNGSPGSVALEMQRPAPSKAAPEGALPGAVA